MIKELTRENIASGEACSSFYWNIDTNFFILIVLTISTYVNAVEAQEDEPECVKNWRKELSDPDSDLSRLAAVQDIDDYFLDRKVEEVYNDRALEIVKEFIVDFLPLLPISDDGEGLGIFMESRTKSDGSQAEFPVSVDMDRVRTGLSVLGETQILVLNVYTHGFPPEMTNEQWESILNELSLGMSLLRTKQSRDERLAFADDLIPHYFSLWD